MPVFLMQFAAPLLSFAVAWAVIDRMLKTGLARAVLDTPNSRSLHANPTPRTGGLGLMAGVFAGWAALAPGWLWPVWLIAGLLMAVSLLDDVRGLSAGLRLAVHVLAAAGLAASVAGHLPALALAAVVLAVVWMTNLYNFMDGSDGLAGGMALFGFGAYAAAAWLGGDAGFALAAASISAAAAAFLLFNFHPARIFMGDAGSIPLGFLAAALGLAGWQRGLWPAWFAPLVFSPFIADASVTLAKRLLRGERVWQAHREHYYQRLVQSGFGHRNTALLEYALMAAAGITAVWGIALAAAAQAALGIGWLIAYGLLMLAIEKHSKKLSQ